MSLRIIIHLGGATIVDEIPARFDGHVTWGENGGLITIGRLTNDELTEIVTVIKRLALEVKEVVK